MIALEVSKREKTADIADLRKKGFLPAVFYGKKTKSTPITISRSAFTKVWHEVGESGVVSLKGPDSSVETLIHAVDVDPVTDIPRHVDFYVFEKGKKLEVSVPLEFVGVSGAVKDLGGILVKSLHEIKISADPQSIPHEIQVDIGAIVDFDSQILASQLTLPAGVTLMELESEVVASASRPREEKEEEAAPIDLSAIEVEKKGKKEEEGEAPESKEEAK